MYNESLFSYLCMPTTWHCPHSPTTAAATDHISCLWACDGTNRQTDTVLPYQFTDPATHTMETLAINNHCLHQCSITKVRYG